MSYILDALRKADAQRARDPARGIHALPLQMSSTGESKFRANRVMLWGAMAVGFTAMSVFHLLARGMYIADIIALIGSLDVVLGEIDR